jgi:hypothetical protein
MLLIYYAAYPDVLHNSVQPCINVVYSSSSGVCNVEQQEIAMTSEEHKENGDGVDPK